MRTLLMIATVIMMMVCTNAVAQCTYAGSTAKDKEIAKAGCSRLHKIAEHVEVLESLLFVALKRPSAVAALDPANRGETKVMVLDLMKWFRSKWGKHSVTVMLKYNGETIVEGDTTLFSGDEVTFK